MVAGVVFTAQIFTQKIIFFVKQHKKKISNMLSLIFFYDMMTANNKQQRVAYQFFFNFFLKYTAGLTGVTGKQETAASAASGRQKEDKP